MLRLCAAAAVAVIALVPVAEARDQLTATVVKIDATKRILTLADKTQMTVDPAVDLAPVQPGRRFTIVAPLDEDGYGPATAIVPAG